MDLRCDWLLQYNALAAETISDLMSICAETHINSTVQKHHSARAFNALLSVQHSLDVCVCVPPLCRFIIILSLMLRNNHPHTRVSLHNICFRDTH